MILWVVLIIAVIYYLGRESGYFNSHHNNRNHNQRPYHSGHQKDGSGFVNSGQNPEHNRNKIIYDNNDDQALKIARKRYAEGEISKKEFEKIKSNLKQ
ncbi:putative oligomerization/nucleic acid binding protein [Halanaerobium saccharolyticum]|uniref:Putative oligomerization/nucleic acid binding protein n=2 Tax=Halanaerobium saccharolyticum TaxID=43595 RepID=A0A4R7YT23_9FIRM|nr:SHOCT domain-containing protein [Halanaerobium saccharolyticum]TDW00939.1 putative oligomerization/nucleic acid binding protein [Halanaerobium saccharolyticum]TDX52579.1 putative oligomerization/nucleic acid binding protein [Halanaerobium saccharolyticum]